MVVRGWLKGERTVLAVAWVMPLVAAGLQRPYRSDSSLASPRFCAAQSFSALADGRKAGARVTRLIPQTRFAISHATVFAGAMGFACPALRFEGCALRGVVTGMAMPPITVIARPKPILHRILPWS
jgi:hypothetical protein